MSIFIDLTHLFFITCLDLTLSLSHPFMLAEKCEMEGIIGKNGGNLPLPCVLDPIMETSFHCHIVLFYL